MLEWRVTDVARMQEAEDLPRRREALIDLLVRWSNGPAAPAAKPAPPEPDPAPAPPPPTPSVFLAMAATCRRVDGLQLHSVERALMQVQANSAAYVQQLAG